MNFQFLKFDITPGEKHVGISTIRVDFGQAKVIFRHKISPNQDGGFYCQPACYKVTQYGKDTYVSAFSLDSSYDAEEMKHFILSHVEEIIRQSQAKSAFAPPPVAQTFSQQTQQTQHNQWPSNGQQPINFQPAAGQPPQYNQQPQQPNESPSFGNGQFAQPPQQQFAGDPVPF